MNGLAQKDAYWGTVLEGNPLQSWNVWNAGMLSLAALLGMGKLTVRVTGGPSRLVEILAPVIVMFAAWMVWAGLKTLTAIHDARLSVATEDNRMKALISLRNYIFCAAFINAVMWGLVLGFPWLASHP